MLLPSLPYAKTALQRRTERASCDHIHCTKTLIPTTFKLAGRYTVTHVRDVQIPTRDTEGGKTEACVRRGVASKTLLAEA
jgi:hypothetical protein